MSEMKDRVCARRDFLLGIAGAGMTALAAGCKGAKGLSLSTGGPMCDFRCDPIRCVRIGVIGLGRGNKLAQQMCQMPGTEIRALCDINPVRLYGCRDAIVRLGNREPAVYGADGDHEAWKKLCDRDDVDVVYSVTPRELHAEINASLRSTAASMSCRRFPVP